MVSLGFAFDQGCDCTLSKEMYTLTHASQMAEDGTVDCDRFDAVARSGFISSVLSGSTLSYFVHGETTMPGLTFLPISG